MVFAALTAHKAFRVQVERLVEPGEIPPGDVHTPGVFVQRVVALTPGQAAAKRIERRTVSMPAGAAAKEPS